eukprot:gnl/Trimastix_PCT/801.p1 GENE.gnl/Trimastix_PCT/801~~gnl/Trimastix_PCT/801.p1  ORF type:complete len:456 (-),score=155.62 gnl/Trimastix_PCT/801:69-1436(-)
MKTLLLFALVAVAFADIPVHCVYSQVVGTWELVYGPGRGLYDKCDYFPHEHRVVLHLSYSPHGPTCRDDYGNTGTWTMVYDEGIEIKFMGRRFQWLFHYDRIGSRVISNCTRNGFPSTAMRDVQGMPDGYTCLRARQLSSDGDATPAVYEEREYTGSSPVPVAAAKIKAPRQETHREMRTLLAAQPFDIDLPTHNGLPREFSLRTNTSWCPPQLDQLLCGSCFSFGLGGCLESRIMKRDGTRPILSRQEIISCDSFTQGCNGGMAFNVGFYMQHVGMLSVNDFGYQYSNDIPCSASHSEGKRFFGKNPRYLGGHYWACMEHSCELEIMQEIFHRGSVEIALKVPDHFYFWDGMCVYPHDCNDANYKPSARLEEPLEEDALFTTVDHSVQIVGWGEDWINGERVPYWAVLNSWGKHWPPKNVRTEFSGMIKVDRRERIARLAVNSMPAVVDYAPAN